METNHQIILLYFREGLSIRKIAKRLGIGRAAVKARIVEYELFKTQPVQDQLDPGSAKSKYLNEGPSYDSSKRIKRRLTAEIASIIEVCLEENETKRLEGRSKQQLRKVDIHEKILSAGYCISYTTVSEYIRVRKSQVREAFIKQGYGEGSICEFDWAEVKIQVGEQYRRYYLAVFTSAYSNYRYVQLFQRLYIPIEKCTTFRLKSVPLYSRLTRLFAGKERDTNHAKSGDKSPGHIAFLQGRLKFSTNSQKIKGTPRYR